MKRKSGRGIGTSRIVAAESINDIVTILEGLREQYVEKVDKKDIKAEPETNPVLSRVNKWYDIYDSDRIRDFNNFIKDDKMTELDYSNAIYYSLQHLLMYSRSSGINIRLSQLDLDFLEVLIRKNNKDNEEILNLIEMEMLNLNPMQQSSLMIESLSAYSSHTLRGLLIVVSNKVNEIKYAIENKRRQKIREREIREQERQREREPEIEPFVNITPIVPEPPSPFINPFAPNVMKF